MTEPLLILVDASGTELTDVLTDVLAQIIARITTPAGSDESSLSGTIRAEAESVTELLPALTDSLTDLLADFDAVPVTVSIDGLRWLDGAVRAWGVVTLSRRSCGAEIEVDWVRPPVVHQVGNAWQAEGQARITLAR